MKLPKPCVHCRFRKTEHYPDEEEILRLHRRWNNADYALYDRANLSFWKTIHLLGNDFWDEVRLFKQYNSKIGEYCRPIVQKMVKGPSVIHSLHRDAKRLSLPASRWGDAVTIDPVWCAASHIDIMPFYNILRVKQIPQICRYLTKDLSLKAHMFKIDDKRRSVRMIPDYCALNPENTMIPLDVLATRGLYAWN